MRLVRIWPLLFLSTGVTFLLVLVRYQWNQTNGHHHPSLLPPPVDWAKHDWRRLRLKPEPFMYPQPWALVNLQTQYLVNSLVCGRREVAPILLLILVTSHAGDVGMRNKIRQLLPYKELQRLGMRRLFLLGKVGATSSSQKYKVVTVEEIETESQKHQDVLVGDFVESYKNLTYKHLMGLEWVGRYCPQAQFILKQDDDIIVDFYQLEHLLKQPKFVGPLTQGNHILGKVLSHQPVIRDPSSKWFVSNATYPHPFFPPFVSGWGYITTPQVAKILVNMSHELEYFWIDDMHITGTLRQTANVELLDLDPYFTNYKGQVQCCVASPAKQITTEAIVPYWCDYVVGVPNDDLQLMEIFYAHAKFCHTTKTCQRREGSHRLNNTCVITSTMIVHNFQHNPKERNKGSWKSVKM